MAVDVARHQASDLDLLHLLTAPRLPAGKYRRREAPLDPLLLAAAISCGPHVTRHHYHHHDVASSDPAEPLEQPQAASSEPLKPKYLSKQAPRSQRVRDAGNADKENAREPLQSTGNLPRRPRGASLLQQSHSSPSSQPTAKPQPALPVIRNLEPSPLQVQCMARTRIPTPYGNAFLHLYRNNKDDKEHLAIVVDPAQFETDSLASQFIRSKSLDAQWSSDETELDRLARGAYVGRLTPAHQVASPAASDSSSAQRRPPLVRIHSECFTGETVGSMRCDCGEQLDEAIRQMFLPRSEENPGYGAVIYLRQEGRGIGLLSKLRAYNLQDMGSDTVQANLLLGHGADERKYDIAASIMRDLGLDDGIELLTNNPDKVDSLTAEGISVVNRRAMVPRSWQTTPARSEVSTPSSSAAASTLELDAYLKTKVVRMGHMLQLPSSTT